MAIRRRDFLAASAGVISTLDWLSYFREFGVPGSARLPGIASAVAQTTTPHFLVYWFQEGGWDSYSMFSPLDTRNDSSFPVVQDDLSAPYSDHRYRVKNFGTAPTDKTKVSAGGINYGFLAQDGLSLFPDMAVLSSLQGSTFHSGGRFDMHYGTYPRTLTSARGPDERTVLQAFAESYGASYLLPHISWHRWLADGELSLTVYPEGTGYYEKLGPAFAHTLYGRTPDDLRNRLLSVGKVTDKLRDARIRELVGKGYASFLKDKNSASVKSFASAVTIHDSLVGGGLTVDPSKLFTNAALKAEFGIQPEHEQTSATSVNGNPARTKETPHTNVQAMMAYELMQADLSCSFWIENREIRGFDSHRNRKSVFDNDTNSNQMTEMKFNLWDPLKVFVNKLKTTPYKATGKSLWDLTTIVVCSEMGRTIGGNVDSIVASADSTDVKFQKIMDQDVCQHWMVSSAAFMGGAVKGGTQFGKVGSATAAPIPIMPDGSLDPAFDASTGSLLPGKNGKTAASFIPDSGHVYASALQLSGLDPLMLKQAGRGKNVSPPLTFLKK